MDERNKLTKSDANMWAMLSNLLGGLAAVIVSPLGFLPPLLVFLLLRDRSRFVRRQSAEALNFQLTNLIIIAGAVAVIVIGGIFTLGIGFVVLVPLALVAGLIWVVLLIVWVILASVRTSKGVEYRYPINIRMVK